ncbi:Polysaccharide biosynthesis/export protein [Stieleria varia]|uniref:Polysaccharide biosynthesis/export protein n=2 Tax=Stieleria varia TaxID=2528005 RepID=A0A5C5ZZP5_9BACT|nr:Polysaccharide biosynthesis/export protein [Stieleria varia]
MWFIAGAPATPAQTPAASNHVASALVPSLSVEQNCGCRRSEGGYPCKGGCQKCMMGVDCADNCGAESRWRDMRPIALDNYGPGGYAGPSRYAHLGEYRLRPGDQLQIIYLITRRQETGEYRLAPGDEVLIESVADTDLDRGSLERGLVVQPDGTITVRLVGQVQAKGLTVPQLRKVLEEKYKDLYDEPSIDVTPVKVNTLAEDIRNAVGGASGLQQQALNITVMPDGKIRLPGIGGICVQGFSLGELKREINLRYGELVVGLETEPILSQQAPHFVHVLGQVGQPARVELQGPTTVLGAIAAAGGHLPGANLRQVVVFRRAEDWRLISTMLDLQGAIYGKRPTPADEIWLRDNDVVIVPARPIEVLDNWIDQVFTRGIYGVVPVGLLNNNNN